MKRIPTLFLWGAVDQRCFLGQVVESSEDFHCVGFEAWLPRIPGTGVAGHVKGDVNPSGIERSRIIVPAFVVPLFAAQIRELLVMQQPRGF